MTELVCLECGEARCICNRENTLGDLVYFAARCYHTLRLILALVVVVAVIDGLYNLGLHR